MAAPTTLPIEGITMSEPLRIVTFHDFLPAYRMVSDWAGRRGHRLVLVVVSPKRPSGRFGGGYRELVAALPPEQDVLITSRLRKTAAPLIAALEPDLVVSATFPQRIPPEVTAIPRYGAVNLHPAPLPRGRGPNPARLLYEGDLTVAGALHRIVPEFDAGPVLSRTSRRLPEAAITAELVLGAWTELLGEALDEGVARAVAGQWGEPQDESRASHAALFSEDEQRLDWDEPALVLQRKVAALNLTGPNARAPLDGREVAVHDLRAQPGPAPAVPPGTILERTGNRLLVRAADGAVEVRVGPGAAPAPDGPVAAAELAAVG